MGEKLDILKCYETLDIPPGATVEQVRKSYVELAHVWDPAQHINNPPLRQLAEQKRKEIDAAYAALSEFLPDLRKACDATPSEPADARPADAIGDEIIRAPRTATRTVAIGSIVVILAGVLALIGWSMWRDIQHVKNRPSLDVADDR